MTDQPANPNEFILIAAYKLRRHTKRADAFLCTSTSLMKVLPSSDTPSTSATRMNYYNTGRLFIETYRESWMYDIRQMSYTQMPISVNDLHACYDIDDAHVLAFTDTGIVKILNKRDMTTSYRCDRRYAVSRDPVGECVGNSYCYDKATKTAYFITPESELVKLHHKNQANESVIATGLSSFSYISPHRIACLSQTGTISKLDGMVMAHTHDSSTCHTHIRTTSQHRSLLRYGCYMVCVAYDDKQCVCMIRLLSYASSLRKARGLYVLEIGGNGNNDRINEKLQGNYIRDIQMMSHDGYLWVVVAFRSTFVGLILVDTAKRMLIRVGLAGTRENGFNFSLLVHKRDILVCGPNFISRFQINTI